MQKTDLIIIGSGPGGYRAAHYAATHGLTVTIIERQHAGGTCLNCGCIPTKTLVKNAEVMHTLKEAEVYGIDNLSYTVNFGTMMERKNQVVQTLRSGVETLLATPGITLVRGEARFVDKKVVEVDGEQYTADNIIIATGSSAKLIPVDGIDLPHVLTSTELLDIDHIPQRLCIVGAGVIGMEFASVFNALGSQVTVVEFLKECLPALDSDIAKRLRQALGKQGVQFCMQAGVKAITKDAVVFERKGKEEQVEADIVLVATGRQDNLEGLNPAACGVEPPRMRITVEDNMQTNVPGIYAIGDVNARMMLAHAATFQGLRAVNHILGKKDNIRLDIIPSAIFTLPEAGGVGLTEEQCKAQGLAYTCKKGYYRANGKALAMNEAEGLVKILADNDGRILGCHIYGAHAADLVQEISTLMATDVNIHQLADTVHTHPTIGEILQEVAEQF